MMSPCTPIVLSGGNLGLRHRHLNALVTETIQQGIPFEQIQDLPEETPVDRIFKIDVASKLRNVDYILKNIKDEDMLYVSRALKAKWLLERQHQEIINPKYLEENLYPYMVTTAVSKFKNWLYVHLKDSQMCEIFYNYYSETKFEYALKFLHHCNVAFIISEAPKILENLSPHDFKLLCEKCPQVAKIFFDNILCNDELKKYFLDHQYEFFNSLKVVLKLDADVFFEITENYFTNEYSRSITKHIMAHHKDRFEKKPELYASMLLNMKALAECLSVNEAKEVVLKLARASYLSYRVDYKFVEPLIKRLPGKERAAFKKLVFVEKAVGELIESWPYEIPSLPSRNDYENHVFQDKKYPHYTYHARKKILKRIVKKKSGPKCEDIHSEQIHTRTLLDDLFDQYRFFSFERTLFELRKKIKEESSSQNRQYMMLVLVSKTGGNPHMVASLLQLLEQQSNEPVHVRATIVRSLVKRAAVWRLPQHSWEEMLQFARGLGLDGNEPEADCREGLHSVVIRSLLNTGACEPAIREAFLNDFSYLDEYSTNVTERTVIKEKLPELLLAAASAESSTERQAELLTSLLNMLQNYEVDIANSLLIPAVVDLAKRDSYAARSILRRLYDANIARRTLFRQFFPLVQTDASYLNALRHDTSVLNISTFIDLIDKNCIRPEQFLRKMAIYFAENTGMKERFLFEMKQRVMNNESVYKSMARPLCLLHGANVGYLESLDVKNEYIPRLIAQIRANMHVGRPKPDINDKVLFTTGSKAIANKVLVCPSIEVDKYVNELLLMKRTARMALALAERTDKEADAFVTAAALRPVATLKAALKYIHRRSDYNPRVWAVLKLLINNINLSTAQHSFIRQSLMKLDKIPREIKAEYCVLLFKCLKEDNYHEAMKILSTIEELLTDVDEDFLENLLIDFLQNFKSDTYVNDRMAADIHVRVLVKFLLLCRSEEIQKNRFEALGKRLLQLLELLRNESENSYQDQLKEVLFNLQYNQVFFNHTYISPLPVIENIIFWMRQSLPIELHFNLYVCMHLVMLYFKSIRQGMKSQPDIFNNEKKKLSEGITVVGHIFGHKIAREIKQLTVDYFESAIDLYQPGITRYFDNYFQYDETKFQFIKTVIEGMLEGSVADEARVALYLLQDVRCHVKKEHIEELFVKMKNVKDEKFRYFLFAELFDNPEY